VRDFSSDQVFDYTRKRGVEHAEIVLPTAAVKQDINWARDRQALWNVAEMAEKRKDARVAREYEVALPHELTKAQRVELVREFAGELANRYNVAVDFALHQPHREGDTRNFHAHILTTTRELMATGLGAKASIEWSDQDRGKRGLTPAKQEVKAVRERWMEISNEHLREHGIDARIDHRSLAAQGIEREPGTHLGVAVSGMERRGIETEVGQRIREQQRLEVEARLERAAELGRAEREQALVQRSILDLSGDLQAAKKERGLRLEPVTDEKASAERTVALETPGPERSAPAARQRDRFKGLKLGAGRPALEQGAFGKVRLAAPEKSPELTRSLAEREATAQLTRSVDRYARAWSDAWRMQEQDLPILEHQKLALREAGTELDRVRPGTTQALQNALRYEPTTQRAMTQLQGRERAAQLVAGVEHEGRVQADPNLKAERVVKMWNGLEAQHRELGGWEQRPAREQMEKRIHGLVKEIKGNPQLEAILQQRQQEFGIDENSRLMNVVRTRSVTRALSLGIGGRELERGLSL
jgi:hypothetical protein